MTDELRTLLAGSDKTGAGLASYGAELVLRGELAAAAVAFEMAAIANPKEGRYVAALACVQQRRGQSEDAIANYRRAGELGFRHVDVWTNLAELLLDRLDLAEAVKALEEAIAADPKGTTPSGRRARALIYLALEAQK